MENKTQQTQKVEKKTNIKFLITVVLVLFTLTEQFNTLMNKIPNDTVRNLGFIGIYVLIVVAVARQIFDLMYISMPPFRVYVNNGHKYLVSKSYRN